MANGGKALNQNARKLYGISNIQAPYGAEAYASTGLDTSAKPEIFDSGDNLIIGGRSAISSPKTHVSFNQSISKGITPGERIQATSPLTIVNSTPRRIQTNQIQGELQESGQQNSKLTKCHLKR